MWDFDFLDAIFGGGSPQDGVVGEPQLKGWSPIVGWSVSYSMASAGPFGQYIGLIYNSPGTGLPTIEWERQQMRGNAGERPGGVRGGARPGGAGDSPYDGDTYTYTGRERSSSTNTTSKVQTVNVFGQPRVRSPEHQLLLGFSFSPGGEIPLDTGPPPPPPQKKPRRPKRPPDEPSPFARSGQPEKEAAPPETEPPPLPPGAPRQADGPADALPTNNQLLPPASDVGRQDDFLPWGAWEKPEASLTPRPERTGARPVETLPSLPDARGFWSRGGAGLVGGGMSVAAGVAILMWWNPVGWLAGASVALMLAGGLAASAGGAMQLSQSYAGNSSPEQDEAFSRANAAALAFSSPGSIAGSVAGTVIADDPEAGFDTGAFWGGLAEGIGSVAISLPNALRAIPGIWHAALPWGKALLLSPLWFALATGGGKGSVRNLARVFAAQGRAGPRIRTIEHLGASTLPVADANWARYQTRVLRSREEAVFRVTFQNGSQRLVYADRYLPRYRILREAKFGDMGMMYIPEREAHIMNQAAIYVEMADILGGRTEYFVSSELGASRLLTRFSLEFPAAVESGQLRIIWRP